MVKISVITVCYDAVATIEKTMLSVLNQTYPNVEYIIIDGGSTDGTVDIIKKYVDRLAYWVSEPDKGIYDAMNKGISHTNGDFVYFLGADDILCPNILTKISSLIISCDIYYGNVYMINAHVAYAGKFNSFDLVVKNLPHQGIFYPKRIFKYHNYDLRYKYLADYYLNLLLWRKEDFHYIPYIIANYNDLGSSSINRDVKFEKDRFKILCMTLPWYCFPYILLRKIRTIIGDFILKR